MKSSVKINTLRVKNKQIATTGNQIRSNTLTFWLLLKSEHTDILIPTGATAPRTIFRTANTQLQQRTHNNSNNPMFPFSMQ